MEIPNILTRPEKSYFRSEPSCSRAEPRRSEREPEEDVDIKIEDDTELIFPYEVEGDKTPPPRDVSSDSMSSDSESEDEEESISALDSSLLRVLLGYGSYLAVTKKPSDDEDTKRPRKKLKNSTSDGTEGPSEPHGPPSDS
ncbi:hypothetical protein Tco_0007919 [Tanacetum coccineum]